MSRLLRELSPELYIRACELIAICAQDTIPIMVVETGRSQARQDELWFQGRDAAGNIIDNSKVVTWTRQSKHVMTPERGGKSDAIDICPYDTYQLHGPDKLKWATDDPVWGKIGVIGQRLGLKWGVVLADGKRIDLGHFEVVRPVV